MTNPGEEDLIARLKSQFGDLDLSNLLDGEDAKDITGNEIESEESSLAEPSPEEIEAWQQAQFANGQKQLEDRKEKECHSIIQKRRAELRKGRHEDDGWEQITSPPDLKNQTSMFFPSNDAAGNEILGVHPLLEKLCEGDPEILGTSWLRLYSSGEGDGLSFLNLLETLRGYAGPTVLFIGAIPSGSMTTASSKAKPEPLTNKATTIGFYTTSAWVESNQMTGTTESFLFAMNEAEQRVDFFHPRKKGQPVMFCHPSIRYPSTKSQRLTPCNGASPAKRDGLVHGIGIGGTPCQPRLHLTETLEECRALRYCQLFEDGDLMLGNGRDSLDYFDVECIEVWAVGGDEWIDESLQTRELHRSILHATQEKARKVDKSAMLMDMQSGLLRSQLFSHMGHAEDRCDL